ncbi:MAG: response regulator [Candidatus Cloacimonadota bacterium]|nr:response regulator [Candidatus Cloacimonadota bacterium]
MADNKIKTVLFLDDDKSTRDIVEEILETNSYNVIVQDDNCDIQKTMQEEELFTIITDINMPKISGLEVLRMVRNIDPNMPVILLTGSTETHDMMQAIKYGAYDYLKKPFTIAELLFSVKQAINDRVLKIENIQYKLHLEEMVQDRTKKLRAANKRIEENTIRAIMSMVNALEARDLYTKGHSERVANISIGIAKLFNYSEHELEILLLGALMHDIGKIGVKEDILHKPSRLTDGEFHTIQTHPLIGAKILEPINLDKEIMAIILQHHEHVDGYGYPNKLTGDNISFNARIVAVADAFDAMTTDRPYRDGDSFEYATNEINFKRNIQFDDTVVDKFNILIKQIDKEFLNRNLLHKFK